MSDSLTDTLVMDDSADIVLELDPMPVEEVAPSAEERVLPFSFAKRHGVLIRE